MVLDHVIVDRARLGPPLRARFDVDVRHAVLSLSCFRR
jgi:hypothetical protein